MPFKVIEVGQHAECSAGNALDSDLPKHSALRSVPQAIKAKSAENKTIRVAGPRPRHAWIVEQIHDLRHLDCERSAAPISIMLLDVRRSEVEALAATTGVKEILNGVLYSDS